MISMYSPKIKRYQKKFDYSYAFGAYVVIDLLERFPDRVFKVLLKEDTRESDGVDEVIRLCEERGIAVEYSDRLIEKIASKENTYVVGVFKKFDMDLESGSNHIVLNNPKNMGNIGTIIRTMLGFGYRDLAIIKPAADIWDPKVVRSTMGAIFSIRFEYFDSIQDYIKNHPKNNLYPFMLDGAKGINDVEFVSPYSIIQGNESEGLPSEFQSFGQSVFIPHSKDIDSLNLSVATAISMWEVSKRS